MSLATIAMLLSGAGILVTGYLAVIFLRDPTSAMAAVTHRPDYLPRIMTGRYISFFLLALGATVYGNLAVIAFLFAVFSFAGLYDGWVYKRDGHPYGPHLGAGIAAGLVALIAFLAALAERGAA